MSPATRATRFFVPTLKQAPLDAVAVSHQLLIRAGFVRQLGAGLYTYLPLGRRSLAKIERILREEMRSADAEEFLCPALHPADLWRSSGRWDEIDQTMFRLQDRRGGDYCLAMTHEEVVAAIARVDLHSYRQLPQRWYQISPKFRDEPRARGGLLRGREFLMKDAYSFDLDSVGLDQSFDVMRAAYERIFARCDLPALAAEASSGAMGGKESIEFIVQTEVGEDTVVHCSGCGYTANLEVARSRLAHLRTVRAGDGCPHCEHVLESFPALEVGHIFKQGTRYSARLGATILDASGAEVPLVMGAYGIGLGRLMAAVVETHHDADGIIWPRSLAPFDAVVLTLGPEPELACLAEAAIAELERAGFDVLYDDRDERPGVKFKDADLIGIPLRIAVGRRGLAANAVECKARASPEVELVALQDLARRYA